ncbi:reverse transcriptase family protein [Phaeobacter sp. 11ANDIMAR09]|uniref:reverse transcriptase family protein n=1 Tax=Phaeobacter sp. 11ANDIMAR09 TaxID=1225647 RepID=UPI0006C8C995|nr:reverse transcriptase family protein [Phaeobacter sp. 11ANDIMAR09]KPD12637.1 hypothetical protein AN476_08665 [Phaeobacter sp. 11ANDIMAR09]
MAFDYDLRRVKTKDQLLTYIGLEDIFFTNASDFDVHKYEARLAEPLVEMGIAQLHFSPFYKHEIPKRNPKRGSRVVWEASGHLNNALKSLARRLTLFFEMIISNFPHPHNCGYVRGRNTRDNAQFHIGAKYILKSDIENYFPSISLRRLISFFESLGVNSGIAMQLSHFLCIDQKLPLGLPTSPIIANAISHFMDIDLNGLADKYKAVYSRYADDLTFSSNGNLPQVSEVSEIVARHKFQLSSDKTKYSTRGQNHYVTGLSVSEENAPHAPRKMKLALRQELYFSKKYGLNDHLDHLGISDSYQRQSYINHLDGRVKYVAFQEPRLASKIGPLWQEVLEDSGEAVNYSPKNQHQTSFQFYVDETEFTLDGEKYLALGISASQHQEQLNNVTKRIWEDYIANPWSDGDLDAITKNGIHFTDTTEDLRRTYLTALQPLPFTGYIVFGKLGVDYQGCYLSLLKTVLKRRLMAAESRGAYFYFEQTSKVTKSAITETVKAAWSELKNDNNRHPEFVATEIVDKSYFGIAVPDFMLAVFRRYLMADSKDKQYRRKVNMFEMLRDKIRVIVNADTGEEFGRRNPIRNLDIENT